MDDGREGGGLTEGRKREGEGEGEGGGEVYILLKRARRGASHSTGGGGGAVANAMSNVRPSLDSLPFHPSGSPPPSPLPRLRPGKRRGGKLRDGREAKWGGGT